MKAVRIPNGIIHLSECKTDCPHCTRLFEFEEFEDAWMKTKHHYIRKKCKGCKRFVGITQNFIGDFIAFKLKL